MAVKKLNPVKKEVQFKKLPLDELQATIEASYQQCVVRALKAVKSEDKSRERAALSITGSIREHLIELQTLKAQAMSVDIREVTKGENYTVNGKDVYKNSENKWISRDELTVAERKSLMEYMQSNN